MRKYIFTILIVWFSISNLAFSEISKSGVSKSELCDFAIQAFEQLMKKSPDAKSKPLITKEQCMAISDEEINNAAQKMMQENK